MLFAFSLSFSYVHSNISVVVPRSSYSTYKTLSGKLHKVKVILEERKLILTEIRMLSYVKYSKRISSIYTCTVYTLKETHYSVSVTYFGLNMTGYTIKQLPFQPSLFMTAGLTVVSFSPQLSSEWFGNGYR